MSPEYDAGPLPAKRPDYRNSGTFFTRSKFRAVAREAPRTRRSATLTPPAGACRISALIPDQQMRHPAGRLARCAPHIHPPPTVPFTGQHVGGSLSHHLSPASGGSARAGACTRRRKALALRATPLPDATDRVRLVQRVGRADADAMVACVVLDQSFLGAF